MFNKITWLALLSLAMIVSVYPTKAMNDDVKASELKKGLYRKFGLDKCGGGLSIMEGASTTKLNDYEVPIYVFKAAFTFYRERRKENELGLLEYLFGIMPPKHRELALAVLNASTSREMPADPFLEELPGLKDRLLKLPYVPYNPEQILQKDKSKSAL